MNLRAELEMLANDTEELMKAEPSDRGMQRALMSIVYRIRHTAKRISIPQPEFCVHGVGLPYRCLDCEQERLEARNKAQGE